VAEFAVVLQYFLLVFVGRERFLAEGAFEVTGFRALGGQEGKEVVDAVQHLGVGRLEVLLVVVGDDALLSDAEDAILRDLDAQVGNRIRLPIAEPSNDGLLRTGEDLVDAGQQLDLELIGRLLDDLSGE
jgi:hypothetical protein